MKDAHPAYVVSFTPAGVGWVWRVAPPRGGHVCGQEADLETARRSAAFAEACLRALDRARRRCV